MQVSKPLFTVTQCICPRIKSLSLSLRTNFQVLVLVLVLGPQVLVLVFVLKPQVHDHITVNKYESSVAIAHALNHVTCK